MCQQLPRETDGVPARSTGMVCLSKTGTSNHQTVYDTEHRKYNTKSFHSTEYTESVVKST